MKDIHISPAAQLVALIALAVALAAAVAVQMPDLQRYLKIRSM